MKRNEIGSEFHNVPYCNENNSIFPLNTKWFISGTAALKQIIQDISSTKNINTAALPSWCCSCMIEPFFSEGIRVFFYPVYFKNQRLVCDYSGVKNCDISIVMSYFGYTSEQIIGQPSGIIIRDITHSLFTDAQYDADYFFGSLRKWAGFWTGGFAWKRAEWSISPSIPCVNSKYKDIRRNAMIEKCYYLKGYLETKHYLELFEIAENYLDNCGIEAGDIRDIELAKKIDVGRIRSTRRANANYLLDYLQDYAIFPMVQKTDCPMFVPIMLPKEKRDGLRHYLITRDIYCPIHWPISEAHELNEMTTQLYESELSIVCDQRYSSDDMERIVYEMHNYGIV